MAGSETGNMDEFAVEVRAFLDASAPRRPDPAQAVAWGEGADQIAYFSTDPPDIDRANADKARQWQRRPRRHDPYGRGGR
jgi:acyl-CoA dehydrogenase